MKKTFRKKFKTAICMFLAFIMTVSIIPFAIFAEDELPDDIEYMEEIPFELELEEGDLPLNKLASAKLQEKDLPEYISVEMAESKGHVNRLYAQEPDEYTVMFQNRDASKTVYVFSFPVKDTKSGISAQPMSNAVTASESMFTVNGEKINFNKDNILVKRLDKNSDDHKLYDYNIGIADVAVFNEKTKSAATSAPVYDITSDVKEWTKKDLTVQKEDLTVKNEVLSAAKITAQNQESRISTGGTETVQYAVITVTYSDIAGVNCIKNNSTGKFLSHSYWHDTRIVWLGRAADPYSKWIFYYEGNNKYRILPVTNQSLSIGYNSDYTSMVLCRVSSLIYMYLSYTSMDDVIFLTRSSSYAMNSSFDLTYSSTSTFPDTCHWSLTNHETHRDTLAVRLPENIYCNGELTSRWAQVYPNDATAYELAWFDENDEMLEVHEDDDQIYILNGPGPHYVYCMDLYSGVCSDVVTVTVGNGKRTHVIRPYGENSLFLTMTTISGTNTASLSTLRGASTESSGTTPNSANYEARYYSSSQLFTISPYGENSYKIAATLTASQYNGTNNSCNVPQYSNNYDSTDYSSYTLPSQSSMPNYLSYSSGALGFSDNTSTNNRWKIVPSNTYGYYIIKFSDSSNALKRTSTDGVEVSTYSEGDTSFLWNITAVGLNVPLIRQTKTYYCGPATFLQIMYGAGITVPGANLDAQMDNLATALETNGGTYSDTIHTKINQYSVFNNNNPYTYKVKHIHDDDGCQGTQAQVGEWIESSLNCGFAPFFLTKRGGAPYKYESSATGHYVCIIGYDSITGTVWLSNCHYLNSISGIYAVSLNSLYNGNANGTYYNLDTFYYCD